MLKSTKVQMIVMLAIGGLLGYVAASGKLGAIGQANGEQSRQSVANKGIISAEGAACCPEGLPRGQLLALADTKNGQQGEGIVITVRLPADAVLEIDGEKTTARGESRTFRTPPLKVGGRYSYDLKATANGKAVTRKVNLAHGVDNTFDLRAEFQPAGTSKVETKLYPPLGQPTAGTGAREQTPERAKDEAAC